MFHLPSGYTTGISGRSRGAPQARVPKAQNFVNFMHLLENLVKLYGGGPMEGQHPLLRGILDQPLVLVIIDSEGYL